jgi:protein-S-isoprenylcysteine O-methyltransferase Ste14
MSDLTKKAFTGLVELFVAMVALIFIPAWTIYYWQAWVFLFAFFVPVIVITLDLMKHDPKLLARRVAAGPGAEKEKGQKVIQAGAALAFVALFIVAGLDHHFSWSSVAWELALVGDALVVRGLLFVLLVFKENSFTSATIEVGAEQKVISTGPYAFVRHPMYSGALVMLVGAPLALGSWWGLLLVLVLAMVIVVRLLDEERFLIKNLSGYSDYQKKVKYRLVPWVW